MRKMREGTGVHGEDSDKLVSRWVKVYKQYYSTLEARHQLLYKEGNRLLGPKFQLVSTLSSKKVKDLIKVLS